MTAARRTFLLALDVRRASPFALIVKGDLELRAGDPKGIRNYREAASRDPKLADPWLSIARAELARGRPDAARKAAKKALKRDPRATRSGGWPKRRREAAGETVRAAR